MSGSHQKNYGQSSHPWHHKTDSIMTHDLGLRNFTPTPTVNSTLVIHNWWVTQTVC
jgi:16S rRNA A1518/A1519 N6-dimethyltransferase RsmA/KsgA/DIM1 with predicted DNA glycosylase/AP lyase activity